MPMKKGKSSVEVIHLATALGQLLSRKIDLSLIGHRSQARQKCWEIPLLPPSSLLAKLVVNRKEEIVQLYRRTARATRDPGEEGGRSSANYRPLSLRF